ncbi:v-type ATP synthase subunit F [Acetivibrio straminisolvens JCM 21531]|uniref:V-type ATP synthase subunit F n=1 Tax=Acetivibrio straminisolvens JCM 21531 TaxID=1294263 RepID=W4V4Q4_9FIRM|nr:v-type ATP synthase subunit F [Acetivibrio straminisolvens JCM 21531]
MYKIGVIGDKDSILGFKALGMSVFPVTSALEAQETIDKIASMQYAVIYITEQFAKDIVSTIDKYKDQRFPAIIPFPAIRVLWVSA